MKIEAVGKNNDAKNASIKNDQKRLLKIAFKKHENRGGSGKSRCKKCFN